jgi:hypothetical protein
LSEDQDISPEPSLTDTQANEVTEHNYSFASQTDRVAFRAETKPGNEDSPPATRSEEASDDALTSDRPNSADNAIIRKSFRMVYTDATATTWLVSVTLRLISGFLGIFVTFFLIMQSNDVVELLLNFTAMEFVSQLDDAAFLLAKLGFLGPSFRARALEIEEKKYDVKKPKQWYRIHAQQILLSAICLGLLSGWATVFAKQLKGGFIDKEIFVQMSDEYLADLATLSGRYKYIKYSDLAEDWKKEGRENCGIRWKEHGKIVYESTFTTVENKTKRAFFIYSYCEEFGGAAWTFTYNGCNPCSNYSVRSDMNDPANKFDILAHASSNWLAKKKDTKQEVVLEHFRLFSHDSELSKTDCGGDEELFGPRCEYHKKNCSLLEVLPGEKLQTSKDNDKFTDPFFKLLGNATVAERPVFYSDPRERNQASSKISIIFFNGRRWVYTSNEQLYRCEDCDENKTIAQYLDGDFHPFWSNYSVTLMSDPVDIDTPSDTAYPNDKLNWYKARFGESSKRIQSPFLRENVGSTLQCCRGADCVYFLSLLEKPSSCNETDFDVLLRITTDDNPEEISVNFTLTHPNGTVVMTNVSDPYTKALETEIFQVCVPEGYCGAFTIFDKGGDGILSPGFYDIYLNKRVNLTGEPFESCRNFRYGFCARARALVQPQCGCSLCDDKNVPLGNERLLPTTPFLNSGLTNCGALDNSDDLAFSGRRCGGIRATFGQYCGCDIPEKNEKNTCRLCGENKTIESGKAFSVVNNGETCINYELRMQDRLIETETCENIRKGNLTVQMKHQCC